MKIHATLKAFGGLTLAMAAALGVHAQPAAVPNQGNTTNNAGEAYPNAARNTAPKPAIVQRAENSRPVQATKRVAKRTGNAVKRAGKRTANAVRNTGDRVADKLPPAPNTTR